MARQREEGGIGGEDEAAAQHGTDSLSIGVFWMLSASSARRARRGPRRDRRRPAERSPCRRGRSAGCAAARRPRPGSISSRNRSLKRSVKAQLPAFRDRPTPTHVGDTCAEILRRRISGHHHEAHVGPLDAQLAPFRHLDRAGRAGEPPEMHDGRLAVMGGAQLRLTPAAEGLQVGGLRAGRGQRQHESQEERAHHG